MKQRHTIDEPRWNEFSQRRSGVRDELNGARRRRRRLRLTEEESGRIPGFSAAFWSNFLDNILCDKLSKGLEFREFPVEKNLKN